MRNKFNIKSPLSTGASVDLDDTINTKEALKALGFYKVPTYGLTPYPDQELFDGIKRVQRKHGLPETEEIRPGDATEGAMRFALAEKQGTKADGQKREGKYIWRTRGDSKVRSEHAERNGQTYDWNNPPDGGHPGQAPNCRCWAEPLSCISEEIKRDKAREAFHRIDKEPSRIKAKVNNARGVLSRHRADKDFYHHVNQVAYYAGFLSMVPHPAGRFVGFAFKAGERISANVLRGIEADI